MTQMAGVEALTGPQDDGGRRWWPSSSRRRDVIVDGLNGLPGVSCKKRPHGAFYVFPNIQRHGPGRARSSRRDLLDDAGVACLSGTSFGAHGDGYLRFSYANSVENIQEALSRFETFLQSAPAPA